MLEVSERDREAVTLLITVTSIEADGDEERDEKTEGADETDNTVEVESLGVMDAVSVCCRDGDDVELDNGTAAPVCDGVGVGLTDSETVTE